MAISTSTNYYSNAIVGQPMAGADIDVHERNTTPKFAVGFGFMRADGNVYRYYQAGAAIASPGVLIGTTATNNNLASVDALVVAPATATNVGNEMVKPGAVGSYYVQVTLTTVAANQFAGGTLAITKDTGKGYSYRIRGNTATGDPSSTTFRLELFDKIKVALDNTSDIAISATKYANLSVNAFVLGSTSNIVGIAQAAMSDGNYGWALTRGIGACLASAADTAYGAVIVVASATGTYIQTNTTSHLAFQRIGTTVVPAAAGLQYGIVNVSLE